MNVTNVAGEPVRGIARSYNVHHRTHSAWGSASKRELTPYQQREATKRRNQGESVVDIVCSYNGHHSTISRLAA